MTEKEIYKTTDLYFSAVLATLGYPIEFDSAGKTVIFLIPTPPKWKHPSDIEQDFADDALEVDPKILKTELNRLRDVVAEFSRTKLLPRRK